MAPLIMKIYLYTWYMEDSLARALISTRVH